MFGNRRRRAASNPPIDGSNASASAATAAASAFLKSRASNASLSSAAAAAALRARPTTPTSVADVQTKRTIRRSASNASVGSSASGSTRPQLMRMGSGSSMSERTFRDPSPSRTQGVPSSADAPPVPSIPQHIQEGQSTKSHRRTASLEPPMRVASPPPNKANGRGSSLGGAGYTQPPRRPGQRMSSLSSVQELTGVERPASRGSVNFSLPTNSRPNSPHCGQRRLTSPSPRRTNMIRLTSPNNQDLVYDPNTRRFLPAAELRAIEERVQYSMQEAASHPFKKKRRIPSTAGTHLADGTVGGRLRGTAVDAMEAAQQPAQSKAPVATAMVPVVEAPTAPTVASAPVQEAQPPVMAPKKKRKKVVESDSESDQGSYGFSASDNESDISSRPSSFNTRAGAMLAKKPSIVREDREREEAEDDTPSRPKAVREILTLETPAQQERQISPSPLPRSSMGRGHGRGQASASAAYAEGRQHTRSLSQPAPVSPVASNDAGLVVRDSGRGGRVQSVSPARTTHFAIASENLTVKHQPPARSISPRKSALKHSNSPRGPSPIESSGSPVFQNGSETSNGSTLVAEELPQPKKKANRVSFDETNVSVGQAAPQVAMDSPVVPSPQVKRSWFSISRGKRKDVSIMDDDEIMKPRPALPSFDSVREKKNREVEERVLVKPAEHIEQKPTAPLSLESPPLSASTTGEVIEYPLGQSNDHVVGAILAQDATAKNAANISKSREPLPPQVTSVEGTGYTSDSDGSNYDLETQKSDVGVFRADSVKRGPVDGTAETYRTIASPIEEDDDPTPTEKSNPLNAPEAEKLDAPIPEIAILGATPVLGITEKMGEWPMPGSWDSSSSDVSGQVKDSNAKVVVEHHPTEPSLADLGIAEPTPETLPTRSPSVGEIATHNAHSTPAILEEAEESDTTSIYSDAAEDLSDLDGDGFMSLNAVVESPVLAAPAIAISTPPDSPTTKATKERAYRKSGLSRRDSEPDSDAGWQKAQEYWSSLTADKRQHLESQAREELEAESSDTEVEVKPAPKPKKKKKVVTQPVIEQVQAAPVQQQARPVPRNQRPTSYERTYMIQPGAKAVPNEHAPLKSSMRTEAPAAPDTHIRRSMRNSAPGMIRGSMRESPAAAAEHRGSLQKKYRPMSYPPHEVRANPDQVKSYIQALSIASASAAATKRNEAAASPGLKRTDSGGSNSSFKRSRRNSDVPAFRQSMRGSNERTMGGRQESPMRSSRFSLRSLSPTGSAFRRPFSSSSQVSSPPVSMGAQKHMRGSMRGSQDSTSSKGLFGRSGSAKPAKARLSKQPSRFNDSSDEEEERPAYQSRFADSSDEDEPTPPPRSSGMARTMRNKPVPAPAMRRDDGDSTDLPDSDDDTPISPSINKASKLLGMNGTSSNQGATLASGSLRRSGSGRGAIGSAPVTTSTPRPSHSRRGSFMSILRRKKPDPGSRIRKSDAESPARRDTPLERTKADREAIKNERPATPKLQKRQNSASWPLPAPDSPPKILESEDGRPFTADNGDGVSGAGAEGERPDFGTRRFTDLGAANGVAKAERKKKKFGKLRRMFRLED